MSIKNIRLELARSPENPIGDSGHAYEFRAPLDLSGHLDESQWEEQKLLCAVRRLEDDKVVEHGLLIRTSGGKWMFSYAPGEEDDEAIFRFSSHAFCPGEYVSVTEHDGQQRTFRVASVTDWHPQ